MKRIAPCLWFDHDAEEAVKFYTGIFKKSSILKMSHYGKAGYEFHGRPEGSIMTIEFEINGQVFTALNGGPVFKFNEAVSFQVVCEDQDEIDFYWNKLSEGGDPSAQQCGWLKDRYGVSWQIVPDLLSRPECRVDDALMEALLKMKKIDLNTLQRAVSSKNKGD